MQAASHVYVRGIFAFSALFGMPVVIYLGRLGVENRFGELIIRGQRDALHVCSSEGGEEIHHAISQTLLEAINSSDEPFSQPITVSMASRRMVCRVLCP
jgi:hypothetical protein